MFDKIDQLGVNTLRTLSIEAVQKANSGHPGLPMGAAPMAYALWTKHLKVNPTTSRNWVDRDRFVCLLDTVRRYCTACCTCLVTM